MVGKDILNIIENDHDFDGLLQLERYSQSLPMPHNTKRTIDDYVNHGLHPGSFVTAVLSNDLKQAFGCADAVNTICMRAIVSYIVNSIPSLCHGSPAKVGAWLAKFRGKE